MSLDTEGTLEGEQALLDALLESRLSPDRRRRTVRELFGRFDTLRQIVYAPKRQLSSITKNGEIAHDELQKARKFACALAMVEIKNQPIMSNYDEIFEYCRTLLAGERHEKFYALFLDKSKCLISVECLSTGTVDHVIVYPRKLFDLAFEIGATSIILLHNHPSGKPDPSRTDTKMTKRLAKIGYYLGVPVVDHIIVGKSGTYSFCQEGMIEVY